MTNQRGESQRSRPVEIYDFDDSMPAAPDLPGEVVVAPSADELIDKLAADLVIHAENCVREFGDFHLALSGGSTPVPLYRRLMYDPNYRRLPWRRTHLWIVDERCVPFGDERSNFKMISEIIGDHADIPREQVHPIFATSPSAEVDYERELRETLGWREKGQDRLDYVSLGMGDDGHTASMFPIEAGGTAVLERDRLVVREIASTAEPNERISMTLPLINAARFIGILVTGSKKAPMLKRIVEGDEALEQIPIKGIRPLQGELKWYLDGPACGQD